MTQKRAADCRPYGNLPSFSGVFSKSTSADGCSLAYCLVTALQLSRPVTWTEPRPRKFQPSPRAQSPLPGSVRLPQACLAMVSCAALRVNLRVLGSRS